MIIWTKEEISEFQNMCKKKNEAYVVGILVSGDVRHLTMLVSLCLSKNKWKGHQMVKEKLKSNGYYNAWEACKMAGVVHTHFRKIRHHFEGVRVVSRTYYKNISYVRNERYPRYVDRKNRTRNQPFRNQKVY